MHDCISAFPMLLMKILKVRVMTILLTGDNIYNSSFCDIKGVCTFRIYNFSLYLGVSIFNL